MPAILEYLPYRKRDGTYERDALTHPYLAGHGYAGVRVDIRGSGESDGLLFDEYSQQEQDDALEVIAWLAAQPWCSGAVGMMGISWGGFNALAGRGAPPAGAEGDHHALLDRRPLSRRRALHGRRAAHGRASAGPRSSSARCAIRPIPRWSAIAGARCGCERLENVPLFLETLAAPPAPRRLLEAWLGVRGLRRDPVPGLRGRRLDRRLHQRDPAPARAPDGAAQGSDRALGACLSAFRAARVRRSASCRRRCAGGITG